MTEWPVFSEKSASLANNLKDESGGLLVLGAGCQQFAGYMNSFVAGLSHASGELCQGILGGLICKLQNHRQIHTGHHFYVGIVQEHRSDVGGRASKHIGEQQGATTT